MRQTSHEEKELSLQITESSELPEPLVPLSSFVQKTFSNQSNPVSLPRSNSLSHGVLPTSSGSL